MRAFEFLIEYGSRKGIRDHKYRDGGKPDWYEEAVKLKTDNPRMTATEIGRRVGRGFKNVLAWLTGKPDSHGVVKNDNPPFTSKDFPASFGTQKYFDGAKPWWYEEAIAMRKQGMTYPAIANKLSTPEKKVTPTLIPKWLVKGLKLKSGGLFNPDAPFEPRPRTKKIDTTEIEKLIDAGVDDADIIKYIRDEKGDKIANQVRAMLPKLRQALQPGTEVRNKVTGDDISGFVQENFSD